MKKWILSFSLLTLILFITACGSNSNQSASENTGDNNQNQKELPKISLKYGHNAPADSPTGIAAEKLAEIVSENSGGSFTIDVYPENQLGDNRDLVEQTALGGLDMSMSGLGILGYLADEYNLMQVPFLFRDQEHIHKVVDGDIGANIANRLLKEKDILLLSQSWDRLPRQVTANKEIRSPEDLKNLLLRTGSKGATEAFDILGAKPTSVPLKEVYLSLQNNVIEGVELPADYIVSQSVAEVNTHVSMLNHTYGTQFVAINGKKFSELPEEYQVILSEAVVEAGVFNNELTKQKEAGYIETLEEQGMEIVNITPEEHELFTKIIKDNLGTFEELWPKSKGIGEKILDVK